MIKKLVMKPDDAPETSTVRDYFAGLALQGLLARHGDDLLVMNVATLAYEYADAMLKARKP